MYSYFPLTLKLFALIFILNLMMGSVMSVIDEGSKKRKKPGPKIPNSQRVHLHQPSGHVVVFSDMKLDDSIAIDNLARSEKYEKMHIVGTAINNHEKAKGHLDDFLKKQGLNKGKTKIQYYSGGENVMKQKSENTHEQNFQGNPKKVKLEADKDLAKGLGKGNKVDVYSIAPTHPRHMIALAENKDIKLRTVHHLAGYNSNIQNSPNKKSEFDHWSTLNNRIKVNHPKADLLLTSTPQTFNDKGGSTMHYDQLKKDYPKNHLEAAKKDPFHVNQLRKAERYLEPHRKENKNLPQLHPGAGENNQFAQKSLQHLINQARFDETNLPKYQQTLRNHFNNYLDHALPIIKKEFVEKEPKLTFRLENGVRDAFTKPPLLEACDGVHIACVNNVRKSKDFHSIHSGTFYRDTEKEGENAILRLRQSKSDDQHHGHLVVNQTGEKAIQLLENPFNKSSKKRKAQ